jgi:hypothetical protein
MYAMEHAASFRPRGRSQQANASLVPNGYFSANAAMGLRFSSRLAYQ